MTDEAPYHAHIYYSDEDRPAAERLRGEFEAHSDILFVGRMMDRGVGPHRAGDGGLARTAGRARPACQRVPGGVTLNPRHDDVYGLLN